MISSIARCLLIVAAFARSSSAQCAAWDAAFASPGALGITALEPYDDGSGPALYATGSFISDTGEYFQGVAKWNGASWSPLGGGLQGTESAAALQVFDDGSGPALYVGGQFDTVGGTSANNIAKWDGTNWSPLAAGVSGSPISARVSALCVFDDGAGPALFAAGEFDTAGSVSAHNIAKWDGSSWSALGHGVSASVRALRVFDDGSGAALFVGGDFTMAGNTLAYQVAKWDGSSWSALGHGLSDGVTALEVFDDGSGPALFAGGIFVASGGTTVNHVAKWNGTSWSALRTGVTSMGLTQVYALTVFDDGSGPALYVGGEFTTAGSASASNIAKWNGASWSPLASGVSGGLFVPVLALLAYDDGSGRALYAGGNFALAGGQVAPRLAKWNGASWAAVCSGNGVNFEVTALRRFDDGAGPALYAGGFFTEAGGLSANRIAKWNGSSWSALGSGTDTTVEALEVYDDGAGPALYAAGYFHVAGGTSVNSIAKWNGSSWSALGSGLNSEVISLCVFDDGSGPALYAGGAFSTAGGASALYIAKWNGAVWSPLAASIGDTVYVLREFDDGTGSALYAGGEFTTAGGVAANHIAKWNGASWSPLASGVDSYVNALEVFDDGSGPALYAGGSFLTAGGVPADNIAKWDGAHWSPLGSGVDATVLTLKVFDDGSGPALYAGGFFMTAGGGASNGIAKWNGTSWATLAGGVNNVVAALEVFDDGRDADADLFVGGSFWAAGGQGSGHIGAWRGCGTTSFCFGDGSVVACPCANNGALGHGCDNSVHTSGALLGVSGAASLASDTVLFDASGEKPNALSLLTQGETQISALPFGQGLRCVTGHLVRMYVEHAANGAFSAPTGTEPKVHARSAAGGDTIAAGSSRYYFAYYRDATVLGGCPATSTFNSTQSLRLIWSP